MRHQIIASIAALLSYTLLPCTANPISPPATRVARSPDDTLLSLASAFWEMYSPTPTPEQLDANDCAQNVEACARASNTSPLRAPTCAHSQDCVAYCQGVLGPKVKDPGANCSPATDPSTGENLGGRCTCWDGKGIVDVVTEGLRGVGEMACFVWDDGLVATEEFLKVVGKLPEAKALAWAGRIMKYGGKLLARGSKLGKCDNPICPGLVFTVVDIKHAEKQLGLLDMC
ncbi:hypothetical protein B0A48_08515 [Cryoendolithus antarcticus]|uniref:Uncharacterized protein n=1 Tax=Cryoendolithus antarcticus TaxID=1507870 RepID=A0A1V8T662_9PEZI|nr:hypothetical protein B0A48_08515 [Cryoendolithus antarcticus]